jgi:ribosomal protein S25
MAKPEAATAPVEPEAIPSEPQPAETQTAQIPASEPLPPEPEPIPAATAAPAPASAPVPPHASRDLLVKARATIQDRKHKKLEKILEFLNTKGKITNDEVEKLLHVSDATATRYLSALEKEGKIQQVGKTGKAVEYTRI